MLSCPIGVLMQVWLQEFAWTEDEKETKMERRNRDGPKGRQLAKESMFCFEFAMSMLYWSALVYDHGEVCQYGSVFCQGCRFSSCIPAWDA